MNNEEILMKKSLALLAVLISSSSVYAGIEPFGVDAGLSFGLGSMSSGADTIQGRTMDTLELHVFPGYKYMGFMLGPSFAYDFVGQLTDPASVKGQNLKGHGYTLGVDLQYQWTEFLFTGGIDFVGRYSQSLTTVSGQDSYYSSPFGFRLGVGYLFIPEISADASFTMTWYSNNNLGGKDVSISNDKLKRTNFAIGASYHF